MRDGLNARDNIVNAPTLSFGSQNNAGWVLSRVALLVRAPGASTVG